MIFSEVEGFGVDSSGVLFWGSLGSIFVIPVKLIALALFQIRIYRIGAFCEHAYSVKNFHLEFFYLCYLLNRSARLLRDVTKWYC